MLNHEMLLQVSRLSAVAVFVAFPLLQHWPEAQVPEAAATDDFVNTFTIDTSVTILDTWCVDALAVHGGQEYTLPLKNQGS
jgi:hypothetical protein